MDRNEFFALLRTALMQLDDFDSLRRSPLLSILSESDTALPPFALQQLLLNEIEALAGAADVPPRFWDVLYFRFVNQLNQDKVAYQFGIGVRQLRRLQNNAIEYLAERLWQRFGLDHGNSDSVPDNPAIEREMAWLREEYATEVSRAAAELKNALHDANPLADRYEVTLRCMGIDDESLALIPPQVLRQAMLTVLTAVIAHAGPDIDLSLAASETGMQFVVELVGKTADSLALLGCQPALATVAQLLAPFDGKVEICQETPQSIVLTLPTVENIPVLVLEDNPDTQHLFRRYVANSRYRLLLTDDGRDVIPLAQQHGVRALILDIMMYEMAGWDLLSEWCHHPATKDVPVAVCTILPQEELSYLLGAKAFLQKPVSQTALLKTLDSLTGVSTRTFG